MERFSIAMCAFRAHGGSVGRATVALVGLLTTLAQTISAPALTSRNAPRRTGGRHLSRLSESNR